MSNTIVFRVDDAGNRLLFSKLADAEKFAKARDLRVSSFEIPTGSEELWNVDVTLPKKAAPPPPPPPPEPRRTAREPDPDDDEEETPKRKQKRR